MGPKMALNKYGQAARNPICEEKTVNLWGADYKQIYHLISIGGRPAAPVVKLTIKFNYIYTCHIDTRKK